MINIKKDMYVDMTDVLGQLAIDMRIPYLTFEQLVHIGQKAVIVYKLDFKAKKITFAEMSDVIKQYLSTPFGKAVLKKMLRR